MQDWNSRRRRVVSLARACARNCLLKGKGLFLPAPAPHPTTPARCGHDASARDSFEIHMALTRARAKKACHFRHLL